jgi:hypothetical protein
MRRSSARARGITVAVLMGIGRSSAKARGMTVVDEALLFVRVGTGTGLGFSKVWEVILTGFSTGSGGESDEDSTVCSLTDGLRSVTGAGAGAWSSITGRGPEFEKPRLRMFFLSPVSSSPDMGEVVLLKVWGFELGLTLAEGLCFGRDSFGL